MKKLFLGAALFAGFFTQTKAQSLDFDGVNDYVTITNVNYPSGNFAYTLEAWIYPRTMGVKGIIGWGDYGNMDEVLALRMDNNGIINYWWGDDLYGSTGDVSGAWHHIAVTFDGTTRTMYLDGAAIASNSPNGGMNVTNLSNITIGRTWTGEYFDGQIDEVRVWSTARSANQIADNMYCSLSSGNNLVASYDFNEGVPNSNNPGVTTLIDITANGNDGALNGFALSGTGSNWVANVTGQNPAALASIGSSASAICSGTTVTFTATPAFGGSTPSYLWTKNGSTVGTNSNMYSDNALSSSDVIAVELTSSIGCATSPVTSNTLSVSVTATPTVSISGVTSICAGSSTTFTANGANTYTWSANAGSATTSTVSLNTDDTYTVTGDNGNGCTTDQAVTLTVNTVTVTLSGTAAICAGDSSLLTAGGTATSFTWSANAGSATTTTVSIKNAGVYSVNGSDGTCSAVQSFTLSVNALPTVSFDMNPNMYCLTDPAITLTASPAGGSFSGTAVSAGQFDPSVAGIGTYTLTYVYTDVNNCANNDTAVVDVQSCSMSIGQSAAHGVQIYPNPASDVLYIQAAGLENALLEVYNSLGEKMSVVQLDAAVTSVSVGNLAAGLYTARVISNKTLVSQTKIVKQ